MRGLLLNELAQRVWAVHTEELRAGGHIGDLCVGQPSRIGILEGALHGLIQRVVARPGAAHTLPLVRA